MAVHTDQVPGLRETLRAQLSATHGPLIGGEALATALGLPSLDALRQARKRGQIAVTLFTLPNRRGHFALTLEVADWLASVRDDAAVN